LDQASAAALLRGTKTRRSRQVFRPSASKASSFSSRSRSSSSPSGGWSAAAARASASGSAVKGASSQGWVAPSASARVIAAVTAIAPPDERRSVRAPPRTGSV